jgi:hypothetical protein
MQSANPCNLEMFGRDEPSGLMERGADVRLCAGI